MCIRDSVYTGAGGYVTGVEITPQLSANLDEFPFEITELDYKRSINALSSGSKAIVEYNLKLSPKATSGVKAVTFNAEMCIRDRCKAVRWKVCSIKQAIPDHERYLVSIGIDAIPKFL